MSDKLQLSIERARRVTMSAGEMEEQRRSFAYGNVKIENDDVTRQMIDEAAKNLDRKKTGTNG